MLLKWTRLEVETHTQIMDRSYIWAPSTIIPLGVVYDSTLSAGTVMCHSEFVQEFHYSQLANTTVLLTIVAEGVVLIDILVASCRIYVDLKCIGGL